MGTDEYLLQKAKKEGREEGIERGWEEARIMLAKNLLANTEFDDGKIASLTSIAPALITQLRGNTAASGN